MKTSNLFALIAFAILTIASTKAIAQPPIGRPDDNQRREDRRRPAPSTPISPDAFKRSPDMIETANYTLRCRGGNGFIFREVDGRVSTSGYIITTLEMAFAPSAQAAGSGLQPGECALIERAFSRDEIMQTRDPVKVRFETPANSQLKQTQQGSAVDRSSTAAESYPDAITIPVYLQGADRYWDFKVLDSGNGYFAAAWHGVYKSPLQGTTAPSRNGRIFRNY